MKIQIAVVLGLVLSVLSLSGCTHSNDDGNLMVMHTTHKDDMKSWDPANAYDEFSLNVVPSVYETLYQYDYLSSVYKIVPLLAADMPKYSDDHLTLTIPIKRGVLFQDDPCFTETKGKGRELKASDFIYEFKRLALPSLQSQGWWIFDNKVVGINAFHDKLVASSKEDLPKAFEEPVEGIKALDDYTLQIKLTKPYPQLLFILAMNFTSPVAPEAVKKYGDAKGNITDVAVGTGPFVLKSWERGHHIILDRNPTHHPEYYPTSGSDLYRKEGMLVDAGKTLPFLDRVVVDVIKEAQPAFLNFMSSKLDTNLLDKDNFPTAIVNQVNLSPKMLEKGIHLNMDMGSLFYYVSFNMKDKVVGENKYLRQALSSAIDREKWIDIFTNGTGKKMTTALPPGLQDRPENTTLKYDFDLERAKELLKKAGYPGGKGLATLNFDLRGPDTLNRQLGDFFEKQFAQIGVKINIIPNSFPAYLQKMKEGNLQVSYGGWMLDYPDAENVYQLLYGPNQAPGPNDSNFNNPEMNRMYEEIATMEPGPKRAEIIKKMDDLAQEECPWAFGYDHVRYELSQPWLLNYRTSDIITNRYKYFRVSKETKARYLKSK